MQELKAYPTEFPDSWARQYIGTIDGTLYYIGPADNTAIYDHLSLWKAEISMLKDGELHAKMIARYKTKYAEGLGNFFFTDDDTICGSDYDKGILLEIKLK